MYVPMLDVFFCQIKLFLRLRLAFVFGLQTLYLIDFSKIHRLKGLKSEKQRLLKGHLMNDLL